MSPRRRPMLHVAQALLEIELGSLRSRRDGLSALRRSHALVKLATTREEIAKALDHAGLGPRSPPRSRPRPTMLGQLEIDFGAA